jgi:hypothetical protein
MRKRPIEPNAATRLVAAWMRANGPTLPPEFERQLQSAGWGTVHLSVEARDPELTTPLLAHDHGRGELGMWRASIEGMLANTRRLRFFDPGERPTCGNESQSRGPGRYGHPLPIGDAGSGGWGWYRCRKGEPSCGRLTLVVRGGIGQSFATDLTPEELDFLDGSGFSLRELLRFLRDAPHVPRAEWPAMFARPTRADPVLEAVSALHQEAAP